MVRKKTAADIAFEKRRKAEQAETKTRRLKNAMPPVDYKKVKGHVDTWQYTKAADAYYGKEKVGKRTKRKKVKK